MCQHTEICQVDALELSHPPMWDYTEIHPSAVAWLSLIFSLKLCSSGFIQCVQKILVISLKQVAKVSMDLQPEYSGLQSTAVFLHQSELRPVRSTDNRHKWHEKCPMKLLRLLCSYDTSGGVFDCSFSCCFDPPDSTFCVTLGQKQRFEMIHAMWCFSEMSTGLKLSALRGAGCIHGKYLRSK